MLEPRPSAALYDLLEELGASGGLDETLGALDQRLRRLLHFDVMSVYLPQDGRLARAYSSGGATGPPLVAAQVAETRRPACNRDPGADSRSAVRFRSSLAIPLDNGTEMVGVLALYSAESGVFEPADLGALLWIRAELARAVKHAREAGWTASSAPPDRQAARESGLHADPARRCAALELAEDARSVTAMAQGIAGVQLRGSSTRLRAGPAPFPREADRAEESLGGEALLSFALTGRAGMA
jgi:hypothetical protein